MISKYPFHLKKRVNTFLRCVLSGLIAIFTLSSHESTFSLLSITETECAIPSANQRAASVRYYSTHSVAKPPQLCPSCLLQNFLTTLLHYCYYHCTFLNFSLLDGGHASGFKEGKKKFKKALLQVKGKRKVYASQVRLVSFWIEIMKTSCIYRVRTHLESPRKSLKSELD